MLKLVISFVFSMIGITVSSTIGLIRKNVNATAFVLDLHRLMRSYLYANKYSNEYIPITAEVDVQGVFKGAKCVAVLTKSKEINCFVLPDHIMRLYDSHSLVRSEPTKVIFKIK